MTLAKSYLQKLGKSPRRKQYQTNSWADYVELVCLANPDNEMSVEDMIDRLRIRSKDLKDDDDAEMEEVEDLEGDKNYAVASNIDDDLNSRRAEISDKWTIRVRDYYRVLSLRVDLYGESYPFNLKEGVLKCKDNITDEHLLYIYLLCCSNLYLFDKTVSEEMASCFELICFNCFQKLLPDHAVVHLFGKNPYNKRNRFSTGTMWKKLNKLKRDLNEHLNPHVKKSEFSDNDTGDQGLDLVAWIPCNDKLSSSLIYFAQCACTYDFVQKQHSSSPITWAQKLSFKKSPTNSTFIPHCFRQSDGSWIRTIDIIDTFLIDRKRILAFYRNSTKINFSSLPVYALVQQVIALKEDVPT